ncbi:MAG: prepilin-type N-terminal cleavage/methylation domain-containing protein [Fimbriimonadaceae bacterium]|jgi:prepilin-type N-terminal cleavage/methylation domain-containing protein|nr:prepilin-type N-terminal cleavage/methylation domain-containing protein [Fimbriimonadaceae bacterium]
MKKAFTLIELLVVIAIIAILAAILFPVFAQAKSAAKKTSAISNQKNISTSIFLYTSDYDDIYPRSDGCELNSSLNPRLNGAPAGTDPQTRCQFSSGSFAWRTNHFSWQKWVQPYIKNVDIFWHPGKSRNDATDSNGRRQWSDFGQIAASFALNTAITGGLNTGDIPMASARVFRNSWTGGTQTALISPAETILLAESMNPTSGILPMSILSTEWSAANVTAYPGIVREVLINDVQNKFANGGTGACNGVNDGGAVRNPLIFSNGMTVGFADGSAKFLQMNAIISRTPTAAELFPGFSPAGRCFVPGSTQQVGTTVNLNINYPLWGLSAQ